MDGSERQKRGAHGGSGGRAEADLDTVYRAVALVSLEVLVAVLDRGDGQDDDERQRGQPGRDGRELWEELQDDQDWEYWVKCQLSAVPIPPPGLFQAASLVQLDQKGRETSYRERRIERED